MDRLSKKARANEIQQSTHVHEKLCQQSLVHVQRFYVTNSKESAVAV